MSIEKIARAIDLTYIQGAKARYAHQIPKESLNLFVESLPENLISATELVNLLGSSHLYQKINKSKLIDLLHEIKIQITFVMISYGQFNTSVYDKITSNSGVDYQILNDISILLEYLSLTQDIVIKSRILFERIMNFIGFLEEGRELKGRSKKSKRNEFYKIIKGTPWDFFLKYQPFIDAYDQKFRTAEVHAGSFLKRHLAGKSLPDSDVIMSLSNFLMNIFWGNMKNILQGKNVSFTTWNKGMEKLSGLPAIDVSSSKK